MPTRLAFDICWKKSFRNETICSTRPKSSKTYITIILMQTCLAKEKLKPVKIEMLIMKGNVKEWTNYQNAAWTEQETQRDGNSSSLLRVVGIKVFFGFRMVKPIRPIILHATKKSPKDFGVCFIWPFPNFRFNMWNSFQSFFPFTPLALNFRFYVID